MLFADRVQETTTTTGTGPLALGGAATGYQAFASAFSTSTVVDFCTTDGTNWEITQGTYLSASDTLTRDIVLSSSNAGALVSWGAGSKQVFVTFPAAQVNTQLSSAQHKGLNDLIHFIDDGPADGFASGAYCVTTGGPFATSTTWYTDTTQAFKIVSLVITRNAFQQPTAETWTQYNPDGITPNTVLVDTINYAGAFEINRTRTWTGTTAYDPTVLPLTGWWRAGGYTPGTPSWAGVASAGGSGSQTLVASAFGSPVNGSSLNGYTTVSFVRASAVGLGGPALSTLFGSGAAWTISALVNPTTISSDNGAGTVYQNDSIWGCASAAYAGTVLRTSGVDQYIYNAGYTDAEGGAIATGAWLKIQARYDGTNLQSRVGGGLWGTATTVPVIADLTQTLVVGNNTTGFPLDGLIADLMFCATNLPDATCNNINGYYLSRYGV